MKRSIKIIAIAFGILLVLAFVLAVAAHWLSERKRQRIVQVDVAPVAYAEGDEALAQGKYFFEARGCAECHGADGKGKVFLNDPNGLFVQTPNIAPGPGSVTVQYTERDWVRTIRHGVNRQSHPLMLMSSEDYNHMTDADLARLVAYVRSLPPLAGESAVIRLPLLVKALYAVGMVQDAAEKIDHTRPPSQPVPVAASVEHGAYLAAMCVGCHGSGFSGGNVPGHPRTGHRHRISRREAAAR